MLEVFAVVLLAVVFVAVGSLGAGLVQGFSPLSRMHM